MPKVLAATGQEACLSQYLNDTGKLVTTSSTVNVGTAFMKRIDTKNGSRVLVDVLLPIGDGKVRKLAFWFDPDKATSKSDAATEKDDGEDESPF